MGSIPCDVNSQDTKFGSKIFHSLAVNRDKRLPESKQVLIKTRFKQNRCSGFTRLCFTDKRLPESKQAVIKTCFKQNRCSGFSRICFVQQLPLHADNARQ